MKKAKPKRKKPRSFQKQIKKELNLFARTAFDIRKFPLFLAVTLTFLMLPGSNYYTELVLKPKAPFIRNAPIDLQKPSDYPVRKPNIKDPFLSARSAVVVDVNSRAVLFEKNPHQRLLPASTTKVMTALVALNNFALDDVITINQAHRSIGQSMNLVSGERITVENLLYGLLMHSGNDAAFALAENFSGGYQEFVNEMNKLAQKYHLQNTQFKNVSGIDEYGHFTTVSDLARLSAIAMENPIFAKIVATKEKSVLDVDNTITHALSNRNELLGEIQGIRGTKTGWTEQAGECLVTDTIREGNEIITVVLGSNDRFEESRTLIEWAYSSHQWNSPKKI